MTESWDIRKVDDETIYSTIEFMRTLLVGRLVEITGIPWFIHTTKNHWDVKFDCRFGFSRYEIRSCDCALEKANEYIKDRMNNMAWEIALGYYRYKDKEFKWGAKK